jgi:hypothetical protein
MRIDQWRLSVYDWGVSVLKQDNKPAEKKEAGCLMRMIYLAVVLLIGFLGYAVFLVTQAQSIVDIGTDVQTETSRDLKTVLQKSIEGAYEVRISEEELNAFLARTLAAKQGGMLASQATLEKVLVRIEQDQAEVVMVRKLWGQSFTVSMWLKVNQTESSSGEVNTTVDFDGGPMPIFSFVQRGGRFGKLVVPQGFLRFILPAYKNLAAQYAEETHLAFEEMARIRMEDGVLILDPRNHQESESFGF